MTKQLKELAEGVRPENTVQSTKWALKTYQEFRNSQSNLELVPELNLLESENPKELCKYSLLKLERKMVRADILLQLCISFYVGTREA